MNVLNGLFTFVLLAIIGSTAYALYEATMAIIVISIVGTLIVTTIFLTLHVTRKSYVRFTIYESVIIVMVTYITLILVQTSLILILN